MCNHSSYPHHLAKHPALITPCVIISLFSSSSLLSSLLLSRSLFMSLTRSLSRYLSLPLSLFFLFLFPVLFRVLFVCFSFFLSLSMSISNLHLQRGEGTPKYNLFHIMFKQITIRICDFIVFLSSLRPFKRGPKNPTFDDSYTKNLK